MRSDEIERVSAKQHHLREHFLARASSFCKMAMSNVYKLTHFKSGGSGNQDEVGSIPLTSNLRRIDPSDRGVHGLDTARAESYLSA